MQDRAMRIYQALIPSTFISRDVSACFNEPLFPEKLTKRLFSGFFVILTTIQPTNQPNNQLTNQPINIPTNPSTNQPAKQANNQPTN